MYTIKFFSIKYYYISFYYSLKNELLAILKIYTTPVSFPRQKHTLSKNQDGNFEENKNKANHSSLKSHTTAPPQLDFPNFLTGRKNLTKKEN